MKSKPWVLVAAAGLVAGGGWFGGSVRHTSPDHGANVDAGKLTRPGPTGAGRKVAVGESGAAVDERAGIGTPPGAAESARSPRPPAPNRRFMDFTAEQRVEFARRGHGPGG